MADDSGDKAQEKAAEGLSQLAARILNQLALSAWLPSAALTLTTAFLLELGAVLDADRRQISDAAASHKLDPTQVVPVPLRPVEVVGHAFKALSEISFGGVFLLVAAVVVLTMLTQAFAFESIRILEGYWGTNRAIERLGQARRKHFLNIRKALTEKERDLRVDAWEEAAAELARREQRRATAGLPVVFSQEMISALGAPVVRKKKLVSLSPDQAAIVKKTDWKRFAPPDLLRRRINVQKRLDDFPIVERRVQPTRLGNILRRFEDATGCLSIESLVDEVYDRLPFSLRVSHDEQRSRLDLYCSMVFVWLAVALVAAARFALSPDTRTYAIVVLSVILVLEVLTYRAAMASARYYGSLLTQIAKYRADPAQVSPQTPGPITATA